MSYRKDEKKSLDLVQRWVLSVIAVVVGGAPTVALAVVPHVGSAGGGASGIGLCVMSGVVGLLTALAVLLIHRVRGWMLALIVLGLVPAGISAYYLAF